MASHYYDWHVGRIHYKKNGLGDPVLLVHGLYPGASNEEFEFNIRALSRDFRVYAIDLLGFGMSDAPPIRYRASLYPNLLKDFVRDVIGSPTCAVATGESASYLAAAAAEQPDLISKLVFISPQCTGRKNCNPHGWLKRLTQEFVRAMLVATPLRLLFQEVMAGEWEIGEMLRRNFRETKSISPIQVERLCELARMPGVLDSYASLEVGLLSMSFETPLQRVIAPMLCIGGTSVAHDVAIRIQALSEVALDLRFEWIERAGRWVHQDSATATNHLIARFFEDQGPMAREISQSRALVSI